MNRSMDFDSVKGAILEALEANTTLGRWEKRRLQRILQSPFRRRAQREVVEFAASQMLAAQIIEPTPEGVMTAVDWDALLKFLEGLLPLIVQLINLFG